MSRCFWWLWSVLIILCSSTGVIQPMPVDAMARPARPKTFDSPDDLRTYLNQLGQYYAVAGRPRFGKRMSGKSYFPLEALDRRYPIEDAADFYELLSLNKAD